MGVGLLVGVWVARYLGPEQFGLLSFAMAFVGLFGAIATLGLRGIAVRDIVRNPSVSQETLGTSFVLQLAGGLVAFLLLMGVIGYLRPDDTFAKTIVAILGFTLVFKASEAVKYWFESQVQSKFTVWTETSVFLTIAVIKVGMILDQAPLIAFIWAAFAEALIVAAALLGIYAWKGGKLANWRYNLSRAKELVSQSWPLILSGIAIMIQARIDQIMLGTMIGNHEVGQYSAAMRLIEGVAFLPMILAATLAPYITKAKATNIDLYHARLTDVYRLMFISFLAIAIPIFLLGDKLVIILFGAEYERAGLLLTLFAIRLFFANFGVGKSIFITNESLFKYALLCAIIGSVVNVILNYILIPTFQAEGAIVATIASFTTTVFLLDLFFTRTRVNLRLMFIAVLSPQKVFLRST
jgi:O-antigen/teichoic acid export membrane protein